MWTIDTTPLATALDAAKQAGYDAVELRRTDFKRCFDTGMSNDTVLGLIKKSGISEQESSYQLFENEIKYREGILWGAMMGAFGGFGQSAVNPINGGPAGSWGMPITGTPIGLPGPPHIPLGVPAGLFAGGIAAKFVTFGTPPMKKLPWSSITRGFFKNFFAFPASCARMLAAIETR
jgi:hypothetical protein